MNLVYKFSLFAKSEIEYEIEEWQKKKEFETSAEWKLRVTEQKRDEIVNKLLTEKKEQFISLVKPKTLEFSYGKYDADNNILSLDTDYGSYYFKVNIEDAKTLKYSQKNVRLIPKYCINMDTIALSHISLSYNDKTWVSEQKVIISDMDYTLNFSPIEINIPSSKEVLIPQTKITVDNNIDINIPLTTKINDKTFAVIIGNEDYQQVSNVPYAINDAKIFAEYCEKTLGLPQKNIRTYKNATFGIMLSALADAKAIAEAYNGGINIIFYYAGHGVPNEKDNSAYLLPIDADGKQIEACFSVSRLYSELNSLKANSVTVFMDACFSGAQRGEGMLASARGVAIKAKNAVPRGNMVVFSAASGDETAYPYKEKGHGLFTYFLLKKLNETKGDVTLGELGDYITSNVKQQSVVVNRKSQTPTVTVSQLVSDSWRNSKLR